MARFCAAENYGLTTGNRQPKPALAAFATMTHYLAGMRPTGVISLGSSIRGATFASGLRQVAVVWSTTAATGTMTLAYGSRGLGAFDIMGRPLDVVNGQRRTIPLTASPVILTGANISHGAFAALLTAATVSGIPPIAATVAAPDGPQSSLPHVVVNLQGLTNVSTQGTVTIVPPPQLTFSQTVQTYGPLRPSATQSITFTPTMLSGIPDPAAVVTVVVTSNSTGGSPPITATATLSGTTVVTTTAPLAETVAISGTPQVQGSLTGWTASPPVLLNRADQLIGDPGWSPSTFSAEGHLMWDDRYLYVAGVVSDTQFYEPFSGFYMYQGDSLQFNVQAGPQPPTGFGLAMTPQGTQLYRYGNAILPSGVITDAPMAITIRPGSPLLHVVYTVAVPWHDLGLQGPPAMDSSFLCTITVNESRQGVRAGWLTLTASRGTGFSPASYLAWQFREGVTLGALRVAAPSGIAGVTTTITPTQPAPGITTTSTLTFTAPTTAVDLLIAPGQAASAMSITVNGQAIGPLATPVTSTVLQAGKSLPTLAPGLGPVAVDISQAVHPGQNVIVVAAGRKAWDGTIAVLMRPISPAGP